MKPRDYCCCAIPTVNAGIYVTLTEQFAAALLVGILSVATPSSTCLHRNSCISLEPHIFHLVVGAVTFSFAKWILAIVAFVAAGIQLLGFIGVAQVRIMIPTFEGSFDVSDLG
jgi:hypothetical protein